MKRLILPFALTAITMLLSVQTIWAQLTLTGEIRPRAEYRHGFKKLIADGQDPAFFIEQRSRIYANYKKDKLNLFISLQDVRTWGAVSQIYKTDPSLNALNQAWAEYLATDKFSVKIGRQELNYDNARFLGNLGWAQQSRSHDLVLFKYSDSTFQAHAGIAFNQDANTPEFAKLTSTFYSGVNNYKTMQFVWLNKSFGKNNVSFLLLNNGVQTGDADSNSAVSYSQTYGLYGKFNPGKFTVEGELYYQGGTVGTETDLSAFLISASVGYKGFKMFKPSIGFDYLSGNDAGTDKDEAFKPLYGTNHKFYGFMDYFYVGNPHGNVGLTDIYIKGAIPFSKKVKLLVHLHHFMAPESIYSPSTGDELSSTLGEEVDLVLNINLHSSTNLKVGYSQMFATESMEALKGGSKDLTNNWAWVMLTFKPTLLQTK